MSSCLKNMHSCLPPCKYRLYGKKLLQNKNRFQSSGLLFLRCSAVKTAPTPNDSATFTVQ